MSRYKDIVNNRGRSAAKVLKMEVAKKTEVGTAIQLLNHLEELKTYYKQKKFMKEYAKLHQSSLDAWYADVKFQEAMHRVIKQPLTEDKTADFMRLGIASDKNQRSTARGGDVMASVHSFDKDNEALRVKAQSHSRPDIGRGRYN